MVLDPRGQPTARYALNDIYPCIQGEGALTGMPMIMVRTQGCPVECAFCDTKETWALDPSYQRDHLRDALGRNPQWAWASPGEIVQLMRELPTQARFVLLSGGEPGLYTLGPLIRELRQKGYKVCVETSGTAEGIRGCGADWLCISPKLDNPGGQSIELGLLKFAHELKWVIKNEDDARFVVNQTTAWAKASLLNPKTVFSVQPVAGHGAPSPKAYAACLKVAHSNNFRISVQIHKLIGER